MTDVRIQGGRLDVTVLSDMAVEGIGATHKNPPIHRDVFGTRAVVRGMGEGGWGIG